MSVCLAATQCKDRSSWQLGHVLLLPLGEEVHACYIGADNPQLLFLVDCRQVKCPQITVAAATAYKSGLNLGTTPRWACSRWKFPNEPHDPDFVVEQRDGQWIINIDTWHTACERCPICLLKEIGQSIACPWHPDVNQPSAESMPKVVHLVCEKENNTSVIHLRGAVDSIPREGNLWLFHVCDQRQILNLGKRLLPSPTSPAIFVSTLSERFCANEHSSALCAPFQQCCLPSEIFQHFFVKVGGYAAALDVWLRSEPLS